jgi:hypothetical protein
MAPNQTLEPEAIAEQLRALREQIPEFTQIQSGDKRLLNRASLVAPPFIQTTINAVTEHPAVADHLGVSAADQRRAVIDADRWNVVEEEAQALLKGIAAMNLVRRHNIGLTALQSYNICRELVRQKKFATLVPHAEKMKRQNKFSRTRQKTLSAPAEPEPQPQQPK